MISVILNAYDTNQAQRHSTIACIGEIVRFTDCPFELVVVDNEPKYPIRDDYKVFPMYKLIELTPKETVYESYNIGAQAAAGDSFFFIQNDVFLHERTLDKLLVYLENGYEMVFPQQLEMSRADAKEVSNTLDGDLAHIGWRDAGLLGITRKAFNRAGGWPGEYKNLLGEAAFYARCDKAGVNWTDRTNTFVTHIKAGNNLIKDAAVYEKEMAHDAKLLQGEK